MTLLQTLLHLLGYCPREQAGYYCDGTAGRCGWDDNKEKGERV